jgi:cytochrome c peroxidase
MASPHFIRCGRLASVIGAFLWVSTLGIGAAASAEVPLGLPPLNAAKASPALVELGRRIFVDTRFSIDGSMSCASCHMPEREFTDGRARARGLGGKELTRKTPSLLNVRYESRLFWDGRAEDLVAQVRTPLLGPVEHGLSDEKAVGQIVRRNGYYATAFAGLMHVGMKDLSLKDAGRGARPGTIPRPGEMCVLPPTRRRVGAPH